MTSYQIWICEDGRPLARHGAVSLSDIVAGLTIGHDVLGHALAAAMEDVRAGRFLASEPEVELAAD